MNHHLYSLRKIELWFSIQGLGFGLWIAMPTTAFPSDAYSVLLHWLSEDQWGDLFLSVSAAHLTSILVNGRRWWTPLARAGMSLISTLTYAMLAAGFWAQNPNSTAVYTYGVAMVGAGLMCWYWAVKDSVAAWRTRNAHA